MYVCEVIAAGPKLATVLFDFKGTHQIFLWGSHDSLLYLICNLPVDAFKL